MKLYCPECETRYEGEEHEVCPQDGSRLFQLDAASDEGDPLLGAVIDDGFRIEELLGAGGMGAVYRGIQLSVHREVAIKVLRPDLTDREVMLERFFREAKVVSELTHPNIVRLIEFGQDRQRDLLYLAMELVRGMALSELLNGSRVRTNLALEVIYQVCGALTEPHARDIIHRDMKPDNLIILPISDGTLQVKVLDFGIARALEGNTQLTKTGMICGTPSYMSPEQAQNDSIDGRTDLYALGVILFEMLTGSPPFAGDTALQVLLHHIQRPAPNLREIMPPGSVPDPVCELVSQLLSKVPDERPASARSVRDRIDQIRMQLQLKPVRLNVDDTFDAWLLPGIELEEAQKNQNTGPGDSDLPVGLESFSTGEVGRPGPKTGEVESAKTDVYQRDTNQPAHIGVADTLNATPEPMVAASMVAGSGPDVAPANPSPSSPKTMPGEYGGIEERPGQDHTTNVVDSASVKTRPGKNRVDSAISTPSPDSTNAPAGTTTTPVILGAGVVFVLIFCAMSGFIAYQVLGPFDEQPEAVVERPTPPQTPQDGAEQAREERETESEPHALSDRAIGNATDVIWNALVMARSEHDKNSPEPGVSADVESESDESTGGAEATGGARRGAAPTPDRQDRPSDAPDSTAGRDASSPSHDEPADDEPAGEPEATPEPQPEDNGTGRDDLRDRLEQLRRE